MFLGDFSKREFLIILCAMLIGGAATAAVGYYFAERYVESTHAGDPLHKADGLTPGRGPQIRRELACE